MDLGDSDEDDGGLDEEMPPVRAPPPSSAAAAFVDADRLENAQLERGSGATAGESSTFARFAWVEVDHTQEEAKRDPETSDLGSVQGDSLDDAILSFSGLMSGRPAAASLPAAANRATYRGDYCYLCETVRDPTNTWRMQIMRLLDLRDDIDIEFLCSLIADFYRVHLEPFTRREWPARAVEKHMRQCSNDVGFILSHGTRVLSAYNDEFTQFATRKNEEGQPMAPDLRQVAVHLKVLESLRKQCTMRLQFEKFKRM